MEKDYNIRYNIGKAKYVVNYYNGVSTHNDGSKFYDISIFSNKIEMNKFIKDLEKQGYEGR